MNMKNRCLYCYKEIDDTGLHYHPQCAMKLFGMRQAPVLPYNRNNIEQLALQIIEKSTSITGVQPKLALDINPHELINSNIEWEKLLRKFRFDAPVIRFCYASELGNKLLYQHIAPIIEVLKKLKQECFIYLAPSGKADLEELSQCANDIDQKE